MSVIELKSVSKWYGEVIGLNNLRHLDLDNTQVSDAGMQHLQGLSNLQRLYLDHTRVRNHATEELCNHVHGCVIIRMSEYQ